MTRFFFSGNGEQVKSGYHGLIAGLAVGAVVYNAAAWLLRREKHLAANVAVYGGLVALELRKIAHHRRALLLLLVVAGASGCLHRVTVDPPQPVTRFTVPGWVPDDAWFCVEQPPALDGRPMVWTPTTCPLTIAELRASFKTLLKADPR